MNLFLKRWKWFFLLLVFIVVGLKLVFFSAVFKSDKEEYCFIVDSGSTLKQLITNLKQQSSLKHPWLLYLSARATNRGSQIEPGEYCMAADIRPSQFFYMLANGRVVLHPFTIIDGWNITRVCQQLKKSKGLVMNIPSCSAKTVASALGLKQGSAEGWLYPSTYFYTMNTTASNLLWRAYGEMQRILNQKWEQRDKSVPYKNDYQALIAASLIQKESAQFQDQRKVSSVIINRLNMHMHLGVDSSVLYGLNQINGLTPSQLKINTPYNTYIHYGLPPTPIAMPSAQAIEAALQPINSDYLYYVANRQGTHDFTKTLGEHRAKITEIYGVRNG